MKTYTIIKGNHFAFPRTIKLRRKGIIQNYRIKFDSNCLYEPLDWENDTNKLCGWSYGYHKKNSIRVGWRPSKVIGCVDLFIYIHENWKIVMSDNYMILPVGQEIPLMIFHNYEDKQIEVFLGHHRSIKMSTNLKPTIGYYLNPYFGGNNPAPHDMTINITKI